MDDDNNIIPFRIPVEEDAPALNSLAGFQAELIAQRVALMLHIAGQSFSPENIEDLLSEFNFRPGQENIRQAAGLLVASIAAKSSAMVKSPHDRD